MPARITWASGELQKLVSDPQSRVFRESRRVPIMLQPFQLQDLKSAVREVLLTTIDTYDHMLDGIMLHFEHLKILSNSGSVAAETSGVKLEIQADFYIFRPEIGSTLKGVVNKISKDHVGVLLYNRYNVSCPRPRSEVRSSSWLGNNVQMHQEVTLKLKDKSYLSRLPYFKGKLTSCGKVLLTEDVPQEILKKHKKSKKDLKESEQDILANDEVLRKYKKSQTDNPDVDEFSKKRKHTESHQPDGMCSAKLKKKKVSIRPIDEENVKESPLKSVVAHSRKSEKKRGSLASVDEVDFIPKMPVDENFLSQSILLDQLPSPRANSTHFDLGNILSSQKKTFKTKVIGLSDIEEVSTLTHEAPRSASEVNTVKKKKKKKTDKSASLSSMLPIEVISDFKQEEGQKQKKKSKERNNSNSEEKKKKCLDSTDLSSGHLTSLSKNALELKIKADKLKNVIQDDLNKASDPQHLESILKKPKKKDKERSLQKVRDLTVDPVNNKTNHPPESLEKSTKKDKKRKSHDAESTLKAQSLSVKNREKLVLPSKSETKRLRKDSLSSDIELPLKRSKVKAHFTPETQFKQHPKESKSKSDIPENEQNILASLVQNLDKNLGLVNEEVVSPSKKKRTTSSSHTILSVQKEHVPLSINTKKIDSLSRDAISKSFPLPLESQSKKEKTPSKTKKLSKEALQRDCDFGSDDAIPPGQRPKSDSSKKSVVPLSLSTRRSSDMCYFPGNSVASLDFGIKPRLSATPLMFGDIQGNIPPPPESEISLNGSDSDSDFKEGAMRSPRKPTANKGTSPLASNDESLLLKPKFNHSSIVSSSKNPTIFKIEKSNSVHPRHNLGVVSPKKADNFLTKSPSKLPQILGSPQKHPLNRDSENRLQKTAAALELLSPAKPSTSLSSKTLIVSGLQSESDDSANEASKASMFNRSRDEVESSSDSEADSGSKKITNRFLQSMGVIQSPLKAAQLEDLDSSESDSDSTYTHQKGKKMRVVRSHQTSSGFEESSEAKGETSPNSRTTQKRPAPSPVKSRNKSAVKANVPSRSSVKFDTLVSKTHSDEGHVMNFDETSQANKKSKQAIAKSNSKLQSPSSVQTSDNNRANILFMESNDKSASSEVDVEKMPKSGLALNQGLEKASRTNSAPKATKKSLSLASKLKRNVQLPVVSKNKERSGNPAPARKVAVSPSSNNVSDADGSDLERGRSVAAASVLKQRVKKNKGTSKDIKNSSKSIKQLQSAQTLQSANKTSASTAPPTSPTKLQPKLQANDDDSSDSDLELMRAARLAIEQKKLRGSDPPTKKLLKRGVQQKTSKAVTKSELQLTALTHPATRIEKKASAHDDITRSDSDSGLEVKKTTQNLKQLDRHKFKNPTSTMKDSTKTAQAMVKAKHQSKALTDPANKINEHISKARNDSQENNSDSGPDDRNTTIGLEEHRQNKSKQMQNKEIKIAPKSVKTAKKKSETTSKKGAATSGSVTTSIQSSTGKPVAGKGKLKKESNTDDDISDVFRRLMQQARMEMNKK